MDRIGTCGFLQFNLYQHLCGLIRLNGNVVNVEAVFHTLWREVWGNFKKNMGQFIALKNSLTITLYMSLA